MTSRWAHWSRGEYEDKKGFTSFLTEQETPADMARRMGLQSDGSGGYVDPSTGQVVARTVNNELIFYDPQGGAISAQSDGAQLTQAQPSWRDPVTGELTVPPGKPESPEEVNAIPDAVPAQAPPGYNAFMNMKKKEMYAAQTDPLQAVEDEVQQDVDPDLGFPVEEDVKPEQPTNTYKNLANKMANQPVEKPAPEVNPEIKVQDPTGRQKKLHAVLDRMSAQSGLAKGAGANALSRDDIGKLQNYIKNGSVVKRTPVTDAELDESYGYLKGKHNKGREWTNLQARMKSKGDPPSEMKVVGRARDILRSYLEHMGRSSVTGEDLPFSESELDHTVSLDNGGVDGPDNWAWMEKRFNQVKNKLDDDALLEKLNQMLAVNPKDERIASQEKALKNRFRGDWKDYYEKEGWDKLTQADIRAATGATGVQMLKGLAEASKTSYYKDRGKTRESGRAGGGTSLGVKELQDRLIETLGIPDQDQLDGWDESIVEVLQNLEDARSDLDSAKRQRKKEKKIERQMTLEEFLYKD